MKTTLGGERLGSGKKQVYSTKHFERSTHDLSYKWRSSMSAGTLVPFMSRVGLIGDTHDIDLYCEVMTLPTVGPLFGSFKVQLDVFWTPIRLYNSQLYMNRLEIGNNMSEVLLPLMSVRARKRDDFVEGVQDNEQINPSSLLKYLGLSGIGRMLPSATAVTGTRGFNVVPMLIYWDIYKNYYANKQEERGFAIHTDSATITNNQEVLFAHVYNPDFAGDILDNQISVPITEGMQVQLGFGVGANEPDLDNVSILVGGSSTGWASTFNNTIWDEETKTLTGTWSGALGSTNLDVPLQNPLSDAPFESYIPSLVEFPLENIDTMRLNILRHSPDSTPFVVNVNSATPYSFPFQNADIGSKLGISTQFSQEALGVKTYQSDLLNNWIDTEWIDGASGVNAVTAVDTTGDSFTLDALNLASKVYAMLNRIALSGGTYEDWKEAVYDHYGRRTTVNPVYMGSLIKELGFQEVISTAEASSGQVNQALGTLAGRGRLTAKNKGGKVRIKCDDIGYITGIVSLTPRVEYSQGNTWDMNLITMDDFHKPDLDQIGYQDLMTSQMAWQQVLWNPDTNTIVSEPSAGKQPAWINYMTEIDRVYGNFADRNKEMFMTLNRRYEIDETTGLITDLTTYIDPSKFNQIFADTNLDAQNFWVQIGVKHISRRKMSAKVIPNL